MDAASAHIIFYIIFTVAFIRHLLRIPDRWRGYAGGDFPVELFYRSGRGLRRFPVR